MKGTYILLMELKDDVNIKIGKLGSIGFRKGGYAYVGSAMNNLESRIRRHLRSKKKLHWHVDWFLEIAKVEGLVLVECDRKIECEVAQTLTERFASIKGFGSSDCKCNSHLFFSSDFQPLKLFVANLKIPTTVTC